MSEHLQSPGPGWEALDKALNALPAQAGLFRFDVRDQGGEPPIESVAVLPREGHWHYVTYGLTELYAKSSPDASTSGYGFELTFRIPRIRGETQPPAWPASLLRSVSRYVVETGEVLAAGHHLDVGGPLTTAVETQLCAALVVEEPELKGFAGPFGRVDFVQLVGLAPDELDLLLDWHPFALAERLAAGNPFLVTDPTRASILADETSRRAVLARVEKEGSALDHLYVPLAVRFGQGTAELELPTTSVEPLRRMLKGRLAHGEPVTLEGEEGTLSLEPGEKPGWSREDDDVLVVTVPEDLARQWREELGEQSGGVSRALLQDLWVRIVPSQA